MEVLNVFNQKIFVFCREFKCTEYGSNLLCVLKKIKDNFDIELQNDWTTYWCKNGEQIADEYWRKQYEEFIAEDTEDQTKQISNVLTTEDVTNTSCAFKSESWQILWEDHLVQIHEEYYNRFYDAFEAYYSTLQDNTLINEADQESDTSLADELVSMKLLGLPTAFGNKRIEEAKRLNKQYNMEHFDNNTSDAAEESKSITDIIRAEDKKEVSISKRKPRNRKLRKLPAVLKDNKNLLKYWRKRFSLFSRFDEGIELDHESWFSVTPEKVACHMAQRLSCDLLIDGFCGCGGNAIQFAKTSRHVIAIDIDATKIQMARRNAIIYGVAHKIDFIVGDFLEICNSWHLNADIVFLSPPWGGPRYKKMKSYDIEKFLLPISASALMENARKISSNIALFLPRNANINQVIKLAGIGKKCEIEHNFLDERLVGLTALYGCNIIST